MFIPTATPTHIPTATTLTTGPGRVAPPAVGTGEPLIDVWFTADHHKSEHHRAADCRELLRELLRDEPRELLRDEPREPATVVHSLATPWFAPSQRPGVRVRLAVIVCAAHDQRAGERRPAAVRTVDVNDMAAPAAHGLTMPSTAARDDARLMPGRYPCALAAGGAGAAMSFHRNHPVPG